MHYVLMIVMWVNGGHHVTTEKFETKSACESAQKAYVEMYVDINSQYRALTDAESKRITESAMKRTRCIPTWVRNTQP